MEKWVWKFYCDVGRMGSLDGIFVATKEEVEELVGETLYFGEVLGKHSDIEVDFSMDHVTKVTEDQDFVKKFEEYDCSYGFNPLDYKPEDEEEEETQDYHLYRYDNYQDYWAGPSLEDVKDMHDVQNGVSTDLNKWVMVPDDKMLTDDNEVTKMACEHAQDYFNDHGEPGCTNGFN